MKPITFNAKLERVDMAHGVIELQISIAYPREGIDAELRRGDGFDLQRWLAQYFTETRGIGDELGVTFEDAKR